nr:Ig-like domain-containing protein [Luteibacter sp. ME-Dv--P-043b]
MFYLDPAPMSLLVGGSRQRQATGGVPPYRYTSGNARVATVGTANGLVTALSAGTTNITASDSANYSGSYTVQVTAPQPCDHIGVRKQSAHHSLSASGGSPDDETMSCMIGRIGRHRPFAHAG